MSSMLSSDDRGIKETVLISSSVDGFSILFNFQSILQLLKL